MLQVPVNLLRASRIFTFEPPPGIKANLVRTFSTVPASRMCREPHERARLYFMLAWLHAILQERLRYSPLGWAKKYEFNESDLRMGCDTLDTWLDSTAQGRTNLAPDKVPWSAFRTLLSQCIYGGRIDNEFDQVPLDVSDLAYCHSALSSSAFSTRLSGGCSLSRALILTSP